MAATKTLEQKGIPSSNQTLNVDIQKKTGRSIKDLRRDITEELLTLPVYSFEAENKKFNPPLPRMVPFNPASISDLNISNIRNLPNIHNLPNLATNPATEYILKCMLRNQISSECRSEIDPSNEIRRMRDGGHICFSGPAGSGKTTLLRLIARNSAEGLNGYEKIKNVHIVSSRLFRGDDSKIECLASHVLFSSHDWESGDKISNEEKQKLFEHASSHSKKYLLIFDSLDTLSEELNKISDPADEYDPKRTYQPMVHLKMLLKGKLLTGCRVVTSSRPHAIRNFKGDLVPTSIISLIGFSRQNAFKVIKLYSPQNAEKICQTIKDRPQFFSLFKEPIFLVYLVEIWQKLRSLKYMTATDVLLNVIDCFSQDEHHRQGNYIKLKNMKKLARETLWRKKLDFDETTLSGYGLSLADLTDMCKNATSGNRKKVVLNLTTRDSPFMFSHQLVQEMFAALSVVESNFPKFEERIRVLNEPFLYQTRNFVYGLVFGAHRDHLRRPAIDRKQELLRKTIEEKYARAHPWDQLAIFETLAEAVTDSEQFDLRTSHGVNPSGLPLDDWGLYSTGIAVSQFTFLQSIFLENCAIQALHLRSLEIGIRRCNRKQLKILSFSLQGNPNIGQGVEGVEIACRIVKNCKVNDFNVSNCGLNSDSMKEMLHGLRETKIAMLALENNKIGHEGMKIAGQLVKHCSIKDIFLTGCPGTFEEAEAFGISASGSDIHRLIAHDNTGKIVAGYGSTIRHCSLKTFYTLCSALQPDDAARMKAVAFDGMICEMHFTPPSLVAVGGVNDISYDTLITVLPLVKDEITLPLYLAIKFIERIQKTLDGCRVPVIKLTGGERPLNLIGKMRQDSAADEVHKSYVDDAVVTDVGDTCKDEESTTAEEEIARDMESEYLDICNGSVTMAWLKKYKMHLDLVADILGEYGLSIHRYNMTNEDCHLVAEVLLHCQELEKFSFTHSTGLQPLLDALTQRHRKVFSEREQKSKKMSLHATQICFAGYHGIDKVLSKLFVEYVKFFEAERLVLTSVNASVGNLLFLRNNLGRVKQGKHFKRLEIFHNPKIDDEGWQCLAGIAKDFEDVAPLELSICYCDVQDEQLETFKNAVESTELGKIDISGNRKLTKKGFQALGEIVKGSKVSSVALQDCNLDMKKIESFNSGCKIESSSQRITFLNVANNPKLGQDGIEEIKKTVHRLDVENLNIASCMLGNVTFEREFESLDISGNPKCESIPELATTVKERLYMRNCMLNTSELMNLATEMEKHQRKLEEIDVSDAGRQIDSDFIDSLVGMFKDVTEYITVADGITIPTADSER